MGNGERTAVILDQHPLWLEALERLLGSVGVKVVGRTTRANELSVLLDQYRPDLIIVDCDGVGDAADPYAVLRRAMASHPDVRAVVLSEDDDPRRIEASFAAGASVFCLKNAEPQDLAAAVRQAFAHRIYVAPDRNGRAQPHVQEPPVDLTPREVEILRLAAEGHSNAQLAKLLWVTEQTVKFHLSNIYRKLEVANRTEASRWAHTHGLLAPVGESAA
jgi:DNA-binding NarL/FixJ family response regulator